MGTATQDSAITSHRRNKAHEDGSIGAGAGYRELFEGEDLIASALGVVLLPLYISLSPLNSFSVLIAFVNSSVFVFLRKKRKNIPSLSLQLSFL